VARDRANCRITIAIALQNFFARSSGGRIKKSMKNTGRKTVRAQTSAPKSAKAKAAAPTSRTLPTQEEIARRSFEIYLARGGAEGSAEQDWLQAEAELLGK
jgi:hypothetical protein